MFRNVGADYLPKISKTLQVWQVLQNNYISKEVTEACSFGASFSAISSASLYIQANTFPEANIEIN